MIGATPDNQVSVYMQKTMHCAVQAPPSEQIELVKRIQNDPTDEESKRLLVDSCIRLVMKIAVKYAGLGIPLDDLVQEGVIGLFKAVERFDPGLGHYFSTYATHWIRQTVSRYLFSHRNTIRLPVYRNDQASKVRKLRSKLAQELGRSPSGQELEKAVEEIEPKLWGMTAADLLKLGREPASLDTSYLDDADDTLGDIISDPDDLALSEVATHQQLRACLNEIIDGWEDEREKDVIRMYYGLEPYGYTRTLDEIGEIYEITRERVRQIKQGAMRKLRHLKNRRKLAEFL
jgi:RNA polymerase primary sigma factor